MIGYALKLFDPSRLVAFHRSASFRRFAQCGPGLKATSRSNVFIHRASKDQIQIGANALIDGTIEVYEKGRLRIGQNFFLGRSRIYCASEVSIGNFVLISDNVAIMDSDLHPRGAAARRKISTAWAAGQFPNVYSNISNAPVCIEDDVWVGYGACILKGTTIGQGAIIGAGSIVTQDVPPWSIVIGNPARVVSQVSENER